MLEAIVISKGPEIACPDSIRIVDCRNILRARPKTSFDLSSIQCRGDEVAEP